MDRYSRQTVLPWFGQAGQEQLRKSSVVVIGCGGTGCVCSSFLARAGTGRLRIVDRDIVDATDLHRQILFTEDDAANLRLKAQVAAERLQQANPDVEIEPVIAEFNPQTAESLIAGADVVVDCSDNFETRMLLNDACLKEAKPWVHGACISTIGIIAPFPLSRTACYRCIVDRIPRDESVPTCEDVGVLGSVAGMVGSTEATEAIKMIVTPANSYQRIIYLDALSYSYHTFGVKRKDDCPVCVSGTYEFLDGRKKWSGYRVCGNDTIHINLAGAIDLDKLKASSEMRGVGKFKDLGGIMRVESGGMIALLFGDGRAIVKGTSKVAEARKFLSELIGQ